MFHAAELLTSLAFPGLLDRGAAVQLDLPHLRFLARRADFMVTMPSNWASASLAARQRSSFRRPLHDRAAREQKNASDANPICPIRREYLSAT